MVEGDLSEEDWSENFIDEAYDESLDVSEGEEDEDENIEQPDAAKVMQENAVKSEEDNEEQEVENLMQENAVKADEGLLKDVEDVAVTQAQLFKSVFAFIDPAKIQEAAAIKKE